MRTLWPWLLLCACATGAPLGWRTDTQGYLPFARVGGAPPTPEAAPTAPATLAVTPGAREAVVDAARRLVGKKSIVVDGKRFGDDCTGLVRAAYSHAGIELMAAGAPGDNGVTAIYRFASRYGRVYRGGQPVEGDIVFFRETWDVNRDGHDNDGLTHVGLVDTVEEDGTVVVIHRVSKGVVRYRMNLAHADIAQSTQGVRWNDWLRAEGPGAKPLLTAQLFAGYATLLPVEARLSTR